MSYFVAHEPPARRTPLVGWPAEGQFVHVHTMCFSTLCMSVGQSFHTFSLLEMVTVSNKFAI